MTAQDSRLMQSGTSTSATPARRSADGCNPRHRKIPETAWGQLRADTEWSLRELADRTGINRGELSRIENGRSCPTPSQAKRMLVAYGLVEVV